MFVPKTASIAQLSATRIRSNSAKGSSLRIRSIAFLPFPAATDCDLRHEIHRKLRQSYTVCKKSHRRHSHSIVLGGFEEMSSATRFTCGISLMIRLETFSSRS